MLVQKWQRRFPLFSFIKRLVQNFQIRQHTDLNPDIDKAIYDKCLKQIHAWFLARILNSGEKKQLIRAFDGFISATGSSTAGKSSIDCFTPIDQPLTDFRVVRELFKRSEKAIDVVGQQYVRNTFDLGGCMKALPIIWKNPEYRRQVVTPGPFFTTMNYLSMVTGHKCNGSGYSELLVESKLAINVCLTGILSGKTK